LTGGLIYPYTPTLITLTISVSMGVWKFRAPLALDFQTNAMGKGSKLIRMCRFPAQCLIPVVYSQSAGLIFYGVSFY